MPVLLSLNPSPVIGDVRPRQPCHLQPWRLQLWRLPRRSAVLLWFTLWVGGLCLVPAVHAQTAFDWGKPPDVKAYATVERCLGLTQNLDSLGKRTQIRQDTLPPGLNHESNTTAPEVSSAARECGAKFSVDQFFTPGPRRVGEMLYAHMLLLSAGRVEEAMTFGDRWLASVPQTEDTLRKNIQQWLVEGLLNARPARFAEAWPRIDSTDINMILKLYWTAHKVRDTAYARRAGEWVLRYAQQFPNTNSDGSEGLEIALTHSKRTPLADSLRVSTRAYLAYRASLRTLAGYQNAEVIVPPIEGDFWFPEKPVQPRPTKGAVSVIATIDSAAWCERCLGQLASLRRLQARFPTVEFTLLTNTDGYHAFVREPPTPAQEAALIDSVYRTIPKLRMTTVIHNTKFWRLPDPDRRRINEPRANPLFFPPGKRERRGEMRLYLVDPTGILLERVTWDVNGEEQLGELLEAFLHQQPSGQS